MPAGPVSERVVPTKMAMPPALGWVTNAVAAPACNGSAVSSIRSCSAWEVIGGSAATYGRDQRHFVPRPDRRLRLGVRLVHRNGCLGQDVGELWELSRHGPFQVLRRSAGLELDSHFCDTCTLAEDG